MSAMSNVKDVIGMRYRETALNDAMKQLSDSRFKHLKLSSFRFCDYFYYYIIIDNEIIKNNL